MEKRTIINCLVVPSTAICHSLSTYVNRAYPSTWITALAFSAELQDYLKQKLQ